MMKSVTSLTSVVTETMELNIDDFVREDCQVVEVDKAAHRAVSPSDIRINRACCQEVLGSNEIRLAVEKRFKGKSTAHGEPGYMSLVAWCLGTDSYKLCQKNLDRVSDADVELAWQFIDTASVSSTRPCRSILCAYKGGRSSVGFRREHMSSPQGNASRRPGPRNTVPPSLVPHTQQDSEGYSALKDIVVEDCMHWILRSPDPTASALVLRSRLLQRDERSRYL